MIISWPKQLGLPISALAKKYLVFPYGDNLIFQQWTYIDFFLDPTGKIKYFIK